MPDPAHDYKWRPITDLVDDWNQLADAEMPALAKVWRDNAVELKKSSAYSVFLEKLIRESAIETGIIERLYSIDRGITEILIEKGIKEALIPFGRTDMPARKVVALISDQRNVIDGLFDFVAGRRQLSTSYVKQLHQALTESQETTEALIPESGEIIEIPLLRGEWKKHPNNPRRPDGSIHEYSPPEHAASEMDRLIAWHHSHTERHVAPEIQAAWLHHRFTQIHPFQDGNGRVARCLAMLVFRRFGTCGGRSKRSIAA